MNAKIAALSAVLLASCAEASLSEEDAIRQLVNDNIARENACDFTGAADFYTETGKVYLPNFLIPQPLVPPETEDREKELCGSGGRVELAIDINDIDVFKEGAALAHGVGTYAEIEASGERSLEGEFSFVYVFIKDDGRWKMHHSHIAQIAPYYPTVPPRE